MIVNSLQKRWALITQLDRLKVAALHKLERQLLQASIKAGNPDIAVFYSPAIEARIEHEMRVFTPWWDRKMLPAERTGRWDEFIKDLYRADLLKWECAEEEIKIERESAPPTTPEEKLAYREAFAKRQLLRLHNADMTVKNTIHLNRQLAERSTTKSGWGND